MRYLAPALLLLAPLLTSGGAKTASPAADLDRIWTNTFTTAQPLSDIRVVVWNIDRGTSLAGLEKFLEAEHPDLCLLQEVDQFDRRTGQGSIAEQIAQRLKLNYAFAAEFQELSQGTVAQPAFQGEAILTRLPMRSVRVLRFQEQSGFWRPRFFLPDWPILQRRLGGRIALVASLGLANGATMLVYNAHLESRSFGSVQERQLDEILADSARQPEGTPMLLAGDLNTKYNPHAFSIKLQRAGWHSAFGSRTPRTHLVVAALDWLVVKGPIRVESGKVMREIGASDHFPITAEIVASD